MPVGDLDEIVSTHVRVVHSSCMVTFRAFVVQATAFPQNTHHAWEELRSSHVNACIRVFRSVVDKIVHIFESKFGISISVKVRKISTVTHGIE